MRFVAKKKSILLLTIATCAFAMLSGCDKKAEVTGVSLAEKTLNIEKLENHTLKLEGADNYKVEWKSDDESVATVKDGIVYAKKKGNTTVSAVINDKDFSCKVIVSDNNYVPTIEMAEADEELKIVKNGSYALAPKLAYNMNEYTDVVYEYTSDGVVLSVDEEGRISGASLGSGVINVTATWRDNKVEAAVPIDVVDASTSIEVQNNEYTVYVNGDGEEWPSTADLGVTVFDKNKQVKDYAGAVTYKELVRKGDTQGAATVSNGKVLARKEGTIHYVAQYKSKAGVTVSSAEITINVKRSPADIYMATIEGKEFEFFFEALGAENSVKWEEASKSFHLINKTTAESDERGFIINKDYLYNIIKYTKAESIAFEYCTDGVRSGLSTDDQVIYQSFYPNWSSESSTQRWDLSKKWTKVEFKFDSIPKDEDSNLKTFFFMNTVEGIYIRNIKLYKPGDDRTNYDPKHNYLEDIQGEEYEFFIESLSDKNSVTWNSKTKLYHLNNTVAEATDARAFIFNRDYLTNVIKHTKAESVSFEYQIDGKNTGFKTDDQTIYQGFYPSWYDADNIQRWALNKKWTKVEIYFKDITKDENGDLKTIFLMNTVGGMNIRNIRFNLPGADKTNYNKKHNYMEDIEGKEYEFFIQSLSDSNTVKWNKKMKAYHLKNTISEATDERGFIFDRDYLTNIVKHTKAKYIVFEVRTDGKKTKLKTDDRCIYQGYYPDWYDAKNMSRLNLSSNWTKVEIDLSKLPKDKNGNVKTVFLMNTVEGMYIRNIKLYKKGQDRVNYDKEHNYLEKIQGKEYEFFIEALGEGNTVKWNDTEKLYQLTNKITVEDDTRGFIFNQEYLTNIIKHTEAKSISFEYRYDGNPTGLETLDKVIYQGFYPNWYDQNNMQRLDAVTRWNKIEIKFSDIPKDDKGNLKTIFLMNTFGGIQIRNINLNVPGQEQPVEKDEHDYLEPIQGQQYEFFVETLSALNTVIWDKNENAYHLINNVIVESDERGFTLNSDYIQKIIDNTSAISISYEFKSDGSRNIISTLDHAVYTGFYPDWYGKAEMVRHNVSTEWKTVEINLATLPKDEAGNIKAPFIMNTVGGLYIRNIKVNLPVQYVVEDSINLTSDNLTWSAGGDTGLTGGNSEGVLTYTSNGFKLGQCFAYDTRKIKFTNSSKVYNSGNVLRMWIKATPNKTDMKNLVIRFYNYGSNGSIGTDDVAYTEKLIPVQGEWTSIEMNLDMFLNNEKQFAGIGFALFGFNDWTSGQEYTLEVDKIEILSPQQQK